VSAFVTGRDAQISARGLFSHAASGAGHKPLICKEMPEKQPFGTLLPVNKL
jgi:hypothetical protein